MKSASTFEGYPALTLSNNRIEAVVLTRGATLASLVLQDDPACLSPLWNPQRAARECGEARSRVFPQSPGFGHFVCVDGFGPGSAEETAAGLPMHGEAHLQPFELVEERPETGVASLTLTATLPLAQERLTRRYRMAEAENVVYVESELENLLAFDRPIVWAEHATVGAPFLERGKTAVDMPVTWARTREYTQFHDPSQRLASDREFQWPLAPSRAGELVDLRTPGHAASGDHTACMMDRLQPLAFTTVLHPERCLLLGYLFRHQEFPWVQNWEYYPQDGQLARGLEFSTQPFDAPRRQFISPEPAFPAPTFRWLPAKSKIRSSFLVFWTRVPARYSRIVNVELRGDMIQIDDVSGQTLSLPASLASLYRDCAE